VLSVRWRGLRNEADELRGTPTFSAWTVEVRTLATVAGTARKRDGTTLARLSDIPAAEGGTARWTVGCEEVSAASTGADAVKSRSPWS
jgi:hypothetical protein